MTGVRAALQRRIGAVQAGDSRGDDGFTMLEIVVVMVIMTVVMVIFTSGITQAFSAENKVDTSVNAESQVLTAFQRLDREVRYASGISNPGTFQGDPVVEMMTTNTGTAICTQIRLHLSTSQLQQRTWTSGVSPFTPSGWQQLASSVSGTTPFVVSQADATASFQKLRVVISATFGINSLASTKQSDVTFTALNTTYDPTVSQPNANICSEGRVTPW